MRQWIVCLRHIPSAEDSYIGPFRTEDGAQRIARRLNGDAQVRGAGDIYRAYVEEISSGGDLMAFRDRMLSELDDTGYGMEAAR